jgi:hypothetical protein
MLVLIEKISFGEGKTISNTDCENSLISGTYMAQKW